MNTDLLLLGAGGAIALLAGGLVATLSPGRFVSLIAAAALASLGLLELGFACAIYELTSSGGLTWFGNSMALAIPVSTVWLLLSVTLGGGRGTRGLGAWRPYLIAQAGLAFAAAIWVIAHPSGQAVDGEPFFPLQGIQWAIVGDAFLNVILLAAKFEATYLSLPPRHRETFRPALVGALGCSGLLAYLIFSVLVSGRLEIGDVSASAAPATLLSFLLLISLIRGRIGEARAAEERLPVTGTTSLLIAVDFVFATAVLLWLTRTAGMNLWEGLFWITVGGIITAIAALTLSNRLRRRLELFLDPLWFEPRAVRRLAERSATAPLDTAASIEELCRMIPENVRVVAHVEPVTLFLPDPASHSFRSVASTLDPGPVVAIPDREPLPVELRRARRPIRLGGRSDDLEYVGIYVENAEQLAACGAVCAVPIIGDEGLIGFLLCGGRAGKHVGGEDLVLLNLASRQYAEHMERLQGIQLNPGRPA